MKWSLPPGNIAGRLVELELQYPCEEIAGVGRRGRNMIFSPCVKSVSRTFNRRHDTLILEAQVRPTLVIVCRRNRSVEDPPTPFIDQQTEGQKRYLVHRLTQQKTIVLVGTRNLGGV